MVSSTARQVIQRDGDREQQQTVGRPAAGVEVTNADDLHFEGNMFTQMAATGAGLHLWHARRRHHRQRLHGIGGALLDREIRRKRHDPVPHPLQSDRQERRCNGDTFKDNDINNVTTEIQGASASLRVTRPTSISSTTRWRTHGISVGFGWTSAVNAMTNNTIDYNNVHDVVHILADGASIYTLSTKGQHGGC